MAYNANLDQFLMFYSQADAGNGLTRGLDNDLARRTYVPTKLDNDLTGAILANTFRLVILTGNAGDGKTAFIQKVEEAAATCGAEITRIDSHHSEFKKNERTFRTLYDGSIDVGSKTNVEVLRDFFRPFEGDAPPSSDICRIIAMNEGKLRDFFSSSTRHRWLSKILLDHLQLNALLPADIALVNLNLRAVVDAKEELSDCLFDRILDRYVATEFWDECQNCPSRHRCPVKFNVDTFRMRSEDGLQGKELEDVRKYNDEASAARVRSSVGLNQPALASPGGRRSAIAGLYDSGPVAATDPRSSSGQEQLWRHLGIHVRKGRAEPQPAGWGRPTVGRKSATSHRPG